MLQKEYQKNDTKPGRSLLRVKEAAHQLGVHPDTIRRWVSTGKLRCRRHPINQYRLFDIQDLHRVIEQIFGHA